MQWSYIDPKMDVVGTGRNLASLPVGCSRGILKV